MKNTGFSEVNIKEVAKLIESLFVRNCVIAGRVANKYEILFADIAYCIYEKKYTVVEDICNEIKKDIIKDDEFKVIFSTFKGNAKHVIRYLFRSINKLIAKETEILNDNKKIHIEHIMPENIKNWDINEDIHEEFLWRLGNLTLLGSEYNKNVSNKSFDEKKKIYDKSEILITRKLLDYDIWNENTIQKRQEQLAELALKAWSIA